MSALGQKQTCAGQKRTSALPPIADIDHWLTHVRFVPIADMRDLRAAPQAGEGLMPWSTVC
jgi:hypothetical protein